MSGQSKGKNPANNKKKHEPLKVLVRGTAGRPDEIVMVPKLKIKWNTFLDKSVILYGGSGSGKTTFLKYIMKKMSNVFPLVFAFAPTNPEKHEIDQIIDITCVYDKFGIADISEIYQRQRIATEIYKGANNPNILYTLFKMVANQENQMRLNNLNIYKNRLISAIKSSNEPDDEINAKIKEVDNLIQTKILALYKAVINNNIGRYDKSKLSEDEVKALHYKRFNPRALVLFTDATNELLELVKEGAKMAKKCDAKNVEGNVISDFFFKGRWALITHMYEFHDDKDLDTRIRKNAFYSIFTEKTTAMGYFLKPSNGFSPRERKIAEEIISVVFDKNKAPEHSKLIYNREAKKFFYGVAKEVGPFKMGSKKLHEFCNRVKDVNITMDTNNSYYKKFIRTAT